MILSCPSCATRWTVKETDLANPGRLVRCSNCGHTWHPETASDEAALPAFFSATPEPASPSAARPQAGAPDAASIVRPPPSGKSIDDDFDAFLNAPISSAPEPDLPSMDFLAAMADAAADAKTSPASNDSIISRSLFAMDDDDDEPSVPSKARGARPLPPADDMVSATALRDRMQSADMSEEFGDFSPPPLNPPLKKGKGAAQAGMTPRRSAGSPLGWALLLLIASGT
ncbi:MAG: MJ0042-type zinc finger domain-containing protein, partial [Elstera sp.]